MTTIYYRINKISILPWGWVMEESNDKIRNPSSFVGAEYGLARYQRVKNYDFNSAYDYWNSTKEYWDIVRYTWDDILFSEDKFLFEKRVRIAHYLCIILLKQSYLKILMTSRAAA